MSKDYRKPAMEMLADKASRLNNENRFWFKVCLRVCVDNPKVFLDSVAKVEAYKDIAYRLKSEEKSVSDYLSTFDKSHQHHDENVDPMEFATEETRGRHFPSTREGFVVKPPVPVINVLEDEQKANGQCVTRLPGFNYSLTDPEVRRQATTFLRMHNGQKIPAIKEVRTMTGVGLIEAKTFVESVLASPDDTNLFESNNNPGFWTGKYDLDHDFGRIHPSDERVKETAQAYVGINQMINGIKAIRAMTGLGLKEAKDLFDSFKPENRRPL